MRDSLAEQLSVFDNKLNTTSSDVDLISGIRECIGQLLQASGNDEAAIRQVLQEQYDSGDLRKETFQLVKSMLDRFSSDDVPAARTLEELTEQPVQPPGTPGINDSAPLELESTGTVAPPQAPTPQAAPTQAPAQQTTPPQAAPPRAPAGAPPVAPQPPAAPAAAAPAAQQAPVSPTPRSATPQPSVAPAAANLKARAPQAPVETSPAEPTLAGKLLRERYLLHKRIAKGSIGDVYQAVDRHMADSGGPNHWVAVKVLSPQLAESKQALRTLQQEAAKGRCLTHPNIVQFLDLDKDDSLYFLVMEWVEGRTLSDILDSQEASKIDTKTAFHIVRQVSKALEYAHGRGIVHADIKPANVMVTADGTAKLFDFGIARILQQADTDLESGLAGGKTPTNSSMQVLTGEEPVAADDVFSLSCLLYRLLAGYRVFGPRNAAEASETGMKPQRLKCLNDSQWRALKKGLSYSRVTRFASMREFIEALDENQEEPFCVEEPDRIVEVEEPSGKGRLMGLMLLLLGGAAYAAYHFGHLDELLRQVLPPQAELVESQAPKNDTTVASTPEIVVPAPVQTETKEPEPAVDETNPFVGLPATVMQSGAEDSATSGSEVPNEEAAAPENVVQEGDEAPAESSDPALLAEAEAEVLPEAAMVASGPVNSMLVDFSTLPEPTEIVPFSTAGGNVKPVNIAVREGDPPVIIDFVRGANLSDPLTLRLEETDFSGDHSPWMAGEYALSNSGLIQFPAGQTRGRVTLTVASDMFREKDQRSTLQLHDASLPGTEYALINVTIEDDDRRQFEARLPANTISYAVNQISVDEGAPAVQVDLVRFNPDSSFVEVRFVVNDVSAKDGDDYFGPGDHAITFAPGQRSARLLIPLVQDAEIEGSEIFMVDIVSDANKGVGGADSRLVVTILDDDPQRP